MKLVKLNNYLRAHLGYIKSERLQRQRLPNGAMVQILHRTTTATPRNRATRELGSASIEASLLKKLFWYNGR